MTDWSEPTFKLNKILLSGQYTRIDKKHVISTSEKNNRFYLLTNGYVKRYLIKSDGNIDVQSFYGPAYFFPLTTVFRGLFEQEIYQGPETYYYQTMTDCKMCYVDVNKLAEEAKKDPLIYRELLMVSGRRLQVNIQQIENRSLRTYYNRVAHQIAFFCKMFSDTNGSQARLKIPLTQQDIADALSTTRETVSLCMSDLRKKGILKPGKYIVVNDLQKLLEEAFR